MTSPRDLRRCLAAFTLIPVLGCVNAVDYTRQSKKAVTPPAMQTIELPEIASAICFSPDGRLLYVGGFNQNIHCFDLASCEKQWSKFSKGGAVYSFSFSPDGKQLAAGLASIGNNNEVILIDPQTGSEKAIVGQHDEFVSLVAFLDNQRLLSAGHDSMIHVWKIGEVEPLQSVRIDQSDEQIVRYALSPDRKTVAALPATKAVSVWDMASGQRKFEIPFARMNWAEDIGFLPSGDLVVLTKLDVADSNDKDVAFVIHDPTSGAKMARWTVKRSPGLNESIVSPQGVIACGTTIAKPQAVDVWDPKHHTLIAHLTAGNGMCERIAFSSDGAMLAAGFQDKSLHVWDLSTSDSASDSQ